MVLMDSSVWFHFWSEKIKTDPTHKDLSSAEDFSHTALKILEPDTELKTLKLKSLLVLSVDFLNSKIQASLKEIPPIKQKDFSTMLMFKILSRLPVSSIQSKLESPWSRLCTRSEFWTKGVLTAELWTVV